MKQISFTILMIFCAAVSVNGQKKKAAAKAKEGEAVKTIADSLDRAFEADRPLRAVRSDLLAGGTLRDGDVHPGWRRGEAAPGGHAA